jgi:hypothetical protein
MGRYGAIDRAGAASERQSSGHVLMVEPLAFGFNPETAATNALASRPADPAQAREARREFCALAARLEAAGVAVHRLADTAAPAKPDAIFPNNWVSFHADGTMVTYPLQAASRRPERRIAALHAMLGAAGFCVERDIDLSAHEAGGRYLEGTGSLVLDRPGRRAYACLSARTHHEVIADFDRRLGYATYAFRAVDPAGLPLYHSNVVLSLGTRYALICLECVHPDDRAALVADLELGGRTIIDISYAQLLGFAANIIELRDGEGRGIVAMSSGAHQVLEPAQRRALEALAGELVHVPIPTIERVSGGGVRCMIADIHLPRTNVIRDLIRDP